MRRLLALVLLIVGTGGLATAQPLPPLVPPLVKLTGHLDRVPTAHSDFHDLVLDVGGERLRLRDADVVVLSGDAMGGDVLDDASRYTPAFLLAGPREMLAKLRAAKPSQAVAITGVWRRGARTFSVAGVDVAAPTGDAPPATDAPPR